MENKTPQPEEKNTSQEGILDIVKELQTLESELQTLKTNQEELRNMPDRAEKNSLLGEIENKIRETIASISELQNKKMDILRKGDEKYLINDEKRPENESVSEPITISDDPFGADPQSKATLNAGKWRDANPGGKLI